MLLDLRTIRFLVAGALIGLTGCEGSPPLDGSGSDTDAGGSSSDPTTGESDESTGVSAQCDASVIEVMVAEECAQKEACACPSEPNADACVESNLLGALALSEAALSEGLSLDCACVEEDRAAWASRGCRPQYEFPTREAFACDACRPWVGDRQEGESCSDTEVFIDNCAQNLRCHGGICVPACDALSAGGPCGGCNRGFGCDEAAGTCIPLGREGESCAPGCDIGFYCDDALGTCTLGLPGGGDCTSAPCRAGDCVFGVCEPEPPMICEPRIPYG